MTEQFALAGSPGRIEVRGDIDLAVATKVLDAIVSPEVAAGQDTVIVDVGGVTFIDSSGLTALVEARQALDAQGVEMWLHDPPPPVVRILQVVGLKELMLRESMPSD